MLSLLLKLSLNIILNFLRKLRYGRRYNSALIERFAYSSSIRLYSNGVCNLGRNIELGKNVELLVHGNGLLSIGDSTYMNNFCMVSCHGRISIGRGCMFGPSVKIFDNNHRFNRKDGVESSLSIGEISIGNNCWIASNVSILKGAKIGNNCVIGCGCIIDKEIPDNTIVRVIQTTQKTEII